MLFGTWPANFWNVESGEFAVGKARNFKGDPKL